MLYLSRHAEKAKRTAIAYLIVGGKFKEKKSSFVFFAAFSSFTEQNPANRVLRQLGITPEKCKNHWVQINFF